MREFGIFYALGTLYALFVSALKNCPQGNLLACVVFEKKIKNFFKITARAPKKPIRPPPVRLFSNIEFSVQDLGFGNKKFRPLSI